MRVLASVSRYEENLFDLQRIRKFLKNNIKQKTFPVPPNGSQNATMA